ncbi:MAG: branched chain amino acid aminotransferase, partial [Pseudomonadota bacterium]
ADEIFLSGNYSKVTPCTQFEERHFNIGPKTTLARDLYMEWAGA